MSDLSLGHVWYTIYWNYTKNCTRKVCDSFMELCKDPDYLICYIKYWYTVYDEYTCTCTF